ncbi:MAG TPA: hypothetical protein VFP33_06910 [Gallionella sp.]|nr:hypothetical protein [Gallionella sp.]
MSSQQALKKLEKLTQAPSGLVEGKWVFDLKATHGLPLDFALDRIINEKNLAIEWVGFIEEARRNKWWDFQTLEVITHAMQDAMLPRDMQSAILDQFKLYVLNNPHPETM